MQIKYQENENGFVEIKATYRNKMVGRLYARIIDEVAEIDRIDVLPDYRREGVATAMLERFREEHPQGVLRRTHTYGDASELWAARYPRLGQPQRKDPDVEA